MEQVGVDCRVGVDHDQCIKPGKSPGLLEPIDQVLDRVALALLGGIVPLDNRRTVSPGDRGGLVGAIVGDDQHFKEVAGIRNRQAASNGRTDSRFLVMSRNHNQEASAGSSRRAIDTPGDECGDRRDQNQAQIRQQNQVDCEDDWFDPER